MRISRTSAVAVLGGVVTVVALAGCGSSSSSGSNDSPSAQQSFSYGDSQFNTGGQLPSYWPADVPTPTGLSYQGGAQTGDGVTGAFAGSTSAAEVQTQLTNDLKAKGWTAEATYGSGPQGGTSTWAKGDLKLALIVTTEDNRTVASITVTK